jgi:hypothetical protein
MKINLLTAFLAVLLSACALKRDMASTKESTKQGQHAQMIDGQASRIR